jgi:hypothetical protein
MSARKFDHLALVRISLSGFAFIFAACIVFELAQAQPGYVPRYTPPPPPVFNPSNPSTVPQAPYRPITPTTPSTAPGYVVGSPLGDHLPRTGARSHRTSVEKTRSVHHQRSRFMGITWPYYCGSSPCVRIVVAEPPPVYRVSMLWWPGYYDYAPGQFARGRPRWGGYPRYSGYHGD